MLRLPPILSSLELTINGGGGRSNIFFGDKLSPKRTLLMRALLFAGQLNAIMGVVQAIVRLPNGKLNADCDYRKGGKPAGY